MIYIYGKVDISELILLSFRDNFSFCQRTAYLYTRAARTSNQNILIRYPGDPGCASMLYFVKRAHFLVKIHVINTNVCGLIAPLSNGRRPLRFKLDHHRHIRINYTRFDRICPFNGNRPASAIVSPIEPPQWQSFTRFNSNSRNFWLYSSFFFLFLCYYSYIKYNSIDLFLNSLTNNAS